MITIKNYIQALRRQVGHQPLILNSASGALVKGQRILLQERADTGDWGFPGGYLEYGESFEQALKREFKEDTGLFVTPIKLLKIMDTFEYRYPNGDLVQPINCFYLVNYQGGTMYQQKTAETLHLAYFELNQPPTFFNTQHLAMFQILKRRLLTHGY